MLNETHKDKLSHCRICVVSDAWEKAFGNLVHCRANHALRRVIKQRNLCSKEVKKPQRLAIVDHTWDEERTILEAGRVEASSKADGLALELVRVRSYIHSTLSMEYGWEGDEPSKLQLAFHRLQTKLAKREDALRVATTEVGNLHALLKTERQSFTSDPTMERELVRLWHSHDRLREIARDVGFNATGLIHTHAHDDPILCTGFGRLCQVVFDHLSHIWSADILLCLLYFCIWAM